VPGVQGHGQVRDDFRQAEEPERQRILRELVDFPADNDELDLRRHAHRQQADDKPAERRESENGVGLVRRAGGRVHCG